MTRNEVLVKEREAWEALSLEFEELYGNINDSKNAPLVAAIRLWGEWRVQLWADLQWRDRNHVMEMAEERYGAALSLKAVRRESEEGRPKFKKGDPVRVRPDAKGKYSGCPGVVEAEAPRADGSRHYRVEVEQLYGRVISVFNEADLEAVEEKSEPDP